LALFGLIFVMANVGTLPSTLGTAFAVLAVAAFVVVLLTVLRPDRESEPGTPGGTAFGRGYWLELAAEVAAGAVGLVVLNGPLDAPDAGVAWIAFVVGVHFFGLAVVWRQSFFRWLGAAITACGALGLILAAAGSSAAGIAAVGGVLPGFVLLVSGLLGPRPGAADGDLGPALSR